MSTFPVIVTAIRDETRQIRSLRLEAAEGALPRFEAGAHVDMHLPGGLVRQYSIASAPNQQSHYLLAVKHEDASRGGSRYLHEQIRTGDRLHIGAPRNLFRLQPASRSVLLAAGIGITPLLSMAHSLQAGGHDFILHYYVHSTDDVAFAAPLRDALPSGCVRVHCSDAGETPRTHVPDSLVGQAADARLYLCGPRPFMETMARRALQHGWPGSHIHREAFGVEDPVAGTDQAFEVELASTGQVCRVPPDRSIASVLLDAGVEVTLSCEQGLCGACLVPVLEGIPEHRDDVLSDSERADNRLIALCCSRSRSQRLRLDL